MKKLVVVRRMAFVLGVGQASCALLGHGSVSEGGPTPSMESVVPRNGVTLNGLYAANGLSAANGLTSVNGISGVNGLASANGLSAVNGLSSINGLSLSNGLVGANGLSSINGISGVNGLAGVNGLMGVNGLTGLNGLTGVNGLTSINGIGFNGLTSINGIGVNGLMSVNGIRMTKGLEADSASHWLVAALRPRGGVSILAGLESDAGLAGGAGLMASEDGRRVASYVVKCALPSDRSLEKLDAAGNVHVLRGSVGVAPEWEHGACDQSCQEWVSACLLGHVNLTGQHVGIWLTAEHPAIDLEKSRDFPLEEASYFGNVFAFVPEAYVCYGRDAKERPIAGRVCTDDASCPYTDPYSFAGGDCNALGTCTPGHLSSGERSGYTECRVGDHVWSRVVTSWKP